MRWIAMVLLAGGIFPSSAHVHGLAFNNALISAQRLGYAYDPAGNLSQRTNDLAVRNFTTDQLNQLTNLTFASPLTVSGVTTTNATNVTVNGLTATLNADGTYTASVPVGNGTNSVTAIGFERFGRRATNTVPVAAAALQYDANGNMLFDGKRAFAYDDENQLTNIVVTNQWKSEFIYDGFGRRRVRKEFTWNSGWSLTNEVRYVFDGLLPIQERDSNNTVKVTYTRGLDLSGGMDEAGGIGGLLARTDANGSAFYHADGNGNVTALINGSQSLVANYSYDPFGNLLAMSGALAPVNPYQFSSKENYRGITLFEARPYFPSLQRFGQADPIGLAGGLNLHRFVDNDPINFIDPWGLLNADRFQEIEYFRLSRVPWWQKVMAQLQSLIPFRNPAVDDEFFYDGLEASNKGTLLEGGGVQYYEQPRIGIPAPIGRSCPITKKLPLPKLKDSPFGPKISDVVPKNGVPRNWTKEQIADAIAEYEISVASRKAEQAAFDAVGRGNATERLAHARRITEEETFLKSLNKALESRR